MQKNKNKRIGILGGSFNPIHKGHIYLAKAAWMGLALDKVLIIPSHISYMKKMEEMASPDARLAMCKLAAQAHSFLSVLSIEIDRGGNSYTYETLEEVKGLYPESELFFIVGTDTLYHMEHWEKPEAVFGNASIVAARREIEELALGIILKYLNEKFGARIYLLDMKEMVLSSSMIREKISEGLYVKNLLDEKVAKYIEENNLYKI